MTEIANEPCKQPNSVRHIRAVQRDRSKRPLVAPPDQELSERLREMMHPAN